jgi:hypothetical protein
MYFTLLTISQSNPYCPVLTSRVRQTLFQLAPTLTVHINMSYGACHAPPRMSYGALSY